MSTLSEASPGTEPEGFCVGILLVEDPSADFGPENVPTFSTTMEEASPGGWAGMDSCPAVKC